MNGASFDRYVIAPSDDELTAHYRKSAGAKPSKQPPALQCATLGAFGGFFCRAFRAHDYALGRRNCQKFLRDYFVLPADNVVMKPSLDSLDQSVRSTVIETFSRPAPGTYAEAGTTIQGTGGTLPTAQGEAGRTWIPLIPLCGTAIAEAERPAREKISSSDVKKIVGLVQKRLRKLGGVFVSQVEDFGLRWFLWPGPVFISWLAGPKIKRAIVKGLGDSYQP